MSNILANVLRITDRSKQITTQQNSVQQLIDSNQSKSYKIRQLSALGFRQCHIAKMLEIIPQFVSNVLARPLKK